MLAILSANSITGSYEDHKLNLLPTGGWRKPWDGQGFQDGSKDVKSLENPVVYINIFGIEWNWWSSPHRWDSIWIALIHSHLEGCMKVDMFFCPDTNSMVGIVELKHYGGLGQFFGTQGLLVVQHWNGRNIPQWKKLINMSAMVMAPMAAATQLQFSIKIMERSDTAHGIVQWGLIIFPYILA